MVVGTTVLHVLKARLARGHAPADKIAIEITAKIEDEEVFVGRRCCPCGSSTSSRCQAAVGHPTVARGVRPLLLPRSAVTPRIPGLQPKSASHSVCRGSPSN